MDEAHCKECNALFDKKRYWQIFFSICRTKQFIRTRKEYVALGRVAKAQANSAARSNSRDLFGDQAA